MKKLLLSLVACGTVLCATHMNASDDLTEGQKGGAAVLATMQTAVDIGSLICIAPMVYHLVNKQMLAFTGISALSVGVGAGAGLIAADGCSEVFRFLRASKTSENFNREVTRVTKEHKKFIVRCGILACVLYFGYTLLQA